MHMNGNNKFIYFFFYILQIIIMNEINNLEKELYENSYNIFLKDCTSNMMNIPWIYTKQEINTSSSKKTNRTAPINYYKLL